MTPDQKAYFDLARQRAANLAEYAERHAAILKEANEHAEAALWRTARDDARAILSHLASLDFHKPKQIG